MALEPLEERRLLSSVQQVTQINASGSSDPSGFTEFNGSRYFRANDGLHGQELWKLDASENVSLVADINPASGSCVCGFAEFNGELYFAANEGTHGHELWKMDPSENVSLVADICPYNGSSSPYPAAQFNGELYFVADDGTHGNELWKMDPSENVSLVADINPGQHPSYPGEFTLFEGSLYFVADPAYVPSEMGFGPVPEKDLWKLDESGGIQRAADLHYVRDINVHNGELYVWAKDSPCDDCGWKSWKLDASGNVSLAVDINAGSGLPWPGHFTAFGDALYFDADDGTHGEELWKLDASGNVSLVADINPGGGSSWPWSLGVFADALYLRAYDPAHRDELWKLDVSGNVSLVADINPGSVGSSTGGFRVLGGEAYFIARDETHGSELWKLDASGNVSLVADIRPGSVGSAPMTPKVFGGKLYFTAEALPEDRELWKLSPGPEDLGPVDFATLQDGRPVGDEMDYRFQTVRPGLLSIDLTHDVTDNPVTLELYDHSGALLEAVTTQGGHARIDHTVASAGEVYTVRATGRKNNVDLRLVNLVDHVGTDVTVYGTEGDDQFEFDASASRVVAINGLQYHFEDTEAAWVTFDGGQGHDTVSLHGSSRREIATLWPDHGVLAGEGYLVTFTSVEATTAHSGGGNTDVAKLYDSSGDDLLETTSEYAKLEYGGNADTFVEARDFARMYTYAGDGFDTATMADSDQSADIFRADPQASVMQGPYFYCRAEDFEQVTATADAGHRNAAVLNDSDESDVLEAAPNAVTLKFAGSDDRFIHATQFQRTYAYANEGGLDTASFADSDQGGDTFVALVGRARMVGPGYCNDARGFEQVSATATAGLGHADVAKLYDSAENDTLDASPQQAKLTLGGSPAEYFLAAGFRYVGVYASQGMDMAALSDSSESGDYFVATADYGKLWGGGFSNCAVGFDQVTGTATPGLGYNDFARLFDSSGDDTFEATPEQATLNFNGSAERFLQAGGFRSVHAYAAKGGTDTAELSDSAQSADTLVATPAQARLYNATSFYNLAWNFDQVTATATAGTSYKDVAKLYDSAGADLFEAYREQATLKFGGSDDYFVQADGFRIVAAEARGDAGDVARLYDSIDNDWLIARPRYGKLYNGEYSNTAAGFRHVHASSDTGGYDRAFLYDSALVDLLEAEGNWARVSCDDPNAGADDLFDYKITAFEYAEAYSQNENDKKEVDPSTAMWLKPIDW